MLTVAHPYLVESQGPINLKSAFLIMPCPSQMLLNYSTPVVIVVKITCYYQGPAMLL